MQVALESQSFWLNFQEDAFSMGIQMLPAQLDFFQSYAFLLQQWNAKINLTSVSDVPGIIRQHFLDSFTLLPFLPPQGLRLDLGTGAGFPGLPLAYLEPAQTWWLVDSSSKKVRFLRHVCQQAALTSVQVLHYHVQGSAPAAWPCFQVVVGRAFASLADFATLALPLLCPQGQLLAMKGQYPEKELQALRKVGKVAVQKVERLYIPHFSAARHLVILEHA